MIFECRMWRAGMVCLGSTTRTMKNPWAPAAACAASSMCVFFTFYEKKYRAGFDMYMLEILRNDCCLHGLYRYISLFD